MPSAPCYRSASLHPGLTLGMHPPSPHMHIRAILTASPRQLHHHHQPQAPHVADVPHAHTWPPTACPLTRAAPKPCLPVTPGPLDPTWTWRALPPQTPLMARASSVQPLHQLHPWTNTHTHTCTHKDTHTPTVWAVSSAPTGPCPGTGCWPHPRARGCGGQSQGPSPYSPGPPAPVMLTHTHKYPPYPSGPHVVDTSPH